MEGGHPRPPEAAADALRRPSPSIPDLSDKVLTDRLAGLRATGLVDSLVDANGIARYRLTARGESLRSVLQALYDWGEAEADTFKVSIRPPAPASD